MIPSDEMLTLLFRYNTRDNVRITAATVHTKAAIADAPRPGRSRGFLREYFLKYKKAA